MLFIALGLIGAAIGAFVALWRKPTVPRHWPILGLALAPQLGNLFGWRMPGMFFWAAMVIFLWCLANYNVPGALLTAIGVGMNLLAMAWHRGYMPIRTDVLASIGQVVAPGTVLVGSKDVAVLTSPVWWLSDWLVVPLPSGPIVASPGDIVVVVGVLWWLVFSHRPEKEHIDVDISGNSNVGRAPSTTVARPE